MVLVKTQYGSHSAVHSNVTSQLLRSNNIATSEYIHLPIQHICSLPLRHCEVPSVFATPSNIKHVTLRKGHMTEYTTKWFAATYTCQFH